jgi:hypothetical protein
MHIRLPGAVLTATILPLLALAPLEAQRRPMVQTPGRAAEVVFMIGGTQLDIGDLNARLAAAGYPTFGEEFLQLGLIGSVLRQRLLLGFEAAGQTRPASATADNRHRVRLAGGYGMVNLGYEVLRAGGFTIRPKAGLGGGGVMLRVADRDPATFDQILVQPGRSVQLGTGSLLLDGSVGLGYALSPRPTPRGLRGLVIGIRAGYTHSVLHGEWMRERSDAPGGPTAGWGGPHVEFIIGRTMTR